MSAAPSHIRPATRGDLPELVDLLNACDVAEVGEPDTTADDVENDWGMEGFELARDAWVAVGDDEGLVGYAYTGDQFRTGELEADLWVHPDHHEPELAPRLLGLAEHRSRELAAERGYEAPMLDIFCTGVNRAKRELLLRHGYALSRTVYRMAADLSDGVAALPVPEGVAIRPFRVDVDERVMHDTMNEAFEDHFRQSEEPFDAWKASNGSSLWRKWSSKASFMVSCMSRSSTSTRNGRMATPSGTGNAATPSLRSAAMR